MSELSEITAERIMSNDAYGTLGYPWRCLLYTSDAADE